MKTQLNKLFSIIILLVLISCNSREANQSEVKTQNDNLVNHGNNLIPEFLNPKYNTGYRLNIDGSSFSEHPFYTFLDCKNEGYFSVHFVPKSKKAQKYWENDFFKENAYGYDDLEKENSLIKQKLTDFEGDFTLYTIHVKKEFISDKENCTEENLEFTQNARADVYQYDSSSKEWSYVKQTPISENFYSNNFYQKDNRKEVFGLNHDFNNDDISDSIKVLDDELIKIILSTDKNVDGFYQFENEHLLSMNKNCPNPPLDTIVSKSIFFTIEKFNCSNEYYLKEYITFFFAKNQFLLNKYGVEYTDKRNPEAEILTKIWTTKDFGEITFENVNEEFLLQLRQHTPK